MAMVRGWRFDEVPRWVRGKERWRRSGGEEERRGEEMEEMGGDGGERRRVM
jgi:hypothetical protein